MTCHSTPLLQHNAHVIQKVEGEVKEEVESGSNDGSHTEYDCESDEEVYCRFQSLCK